MFINKRWVKLLTGQALTEPQAALTENEVGHVHSLRKIARDTFK